MKTLIEKPLAKQTWGWSFVKRMFVLEYYKQISNTIKRVFSLTSVLTMLVELMPIFRHFKERVEFSTKKKLCTTQQQNWKIG